MQIAETLASSMTESNMVGKSSAIIICVIDVLNAEGTQGKVLDDGHVVFFLTYDALVLKLHRGEVIDTVVGQLGPEGWWGNVYGVGKIFISQSQMSPDQGSPSWMYECGEAEGTWMSKDGLRSIKMNDLVRVRILAETPQSQGAIAIGTMLGPYLGPL